MKKNFIIEPHERNKKTKLDRKYLRITAPSDDNKITSNDLKKFYEQLTKVKKISPHDISIIVKSDAGIKTLKSFDDGVLKSWDDENYYEDKPKKKQLSKMLNEYYYVDFILKKT